MITLPYTPEFIAFGHFLLIQLKAEDNGKKSSKPFMASEVNDKEKDFASFNATRMLLPK